MGHLFSKKKESKVTQQDKAVLELKTTRDKLKQYQKRSEATLEKDRELAKQLLQKNKKDRAKLLLRKKRYIEEKLKQTDGKLENIEQLIQDIEFAQVEMKIVASLKVGKDALKDLNDLMSVEDVEKILDETQEAVEKQREIDALLTGGFLSPEEEGEVDEELESLLQDLLEDQLPDVSKEVHDLPEEEEGEEKEEEESEVVLPDVPQGEPAQEKVKEKKVESGRKKVAVEAS